MATTITIAIKITKTKTAWREKQITNSQGKYVS